MIAYVKGTLAYTTDNAAVVEAGGVGYLINVSTATISRLPRAGEACQLFTYHQTTENGQSLHGFLSQEEVRLFMLLISVSGIGPKVATAILATFSPQEVMMAIVAEDAAALSRAPGVGKKTAQRVMLELRDKIKTADTFTESAQTNMPQATTAKQDAMDALLALGYGRAEAMQAVLEIADPDTKADAIIRAALKKLAR